MFAMQDDNKYDNTADVSERPRDVIGLSEACIGKWRLGAS